MTQAKPSSIERLVEDITNLEGVDIPDLPYFKRQQWIRQYRVNLIAAHETAILERVMGSKKKYDTLVNKKDDYWITEYAVPVEAITKELEGKK